MNDTIAPDDEYPNARAVPDDHNVVPLRNTPDDEYPKTELEIFSTDRYMLEYKIGLNAGRSGEENRLAQLERSQNLSAMLHDPRAKLADGL